MTDMRRTVLWVVFSLSLFLIWDAWQRHTGHPSFFAPPPPPTSRPASAAGAAAVPVPAPAAVPPGAAPLPTAALPASAPAPSAEGVQVTVSSDLLRLTLDSKGADLIHAELLHESDPDAASGHVVLFDRSAQRLYLAQTGLIGNAAGAAWPTHETVLQLLPGERELKPGSDTLEVRFESAPLGGIKLVKTYTLRRGSYTVGVENRVENVSGAPLSPQLYLQLVRDGNPAPGGSSFYSTFTGPAVYTDSTRYKKVDFKSLDKRFADARPGEKADYEVSADNGWVAMVQHYFASAWLLPDKTPREIFARKVDANKYAVGLIVPLGTLAPGAARTVDAELFVGPQEEDKLSKLAPGLELVKDYGVFKIIAEPLF